jgi:hypothetical protein
MKFNNQRITSHAGELSLGKSRQHGLKFLFLSSFYPNLERAIYALKFLPEKLNPTLQAEIDHHRASLYLYKHNAAIEPYNSSYNENRENIIKALKRIVNNLDSPNHYRTQAENLLTLWNIPTTQDVEEMDVDDSLLWQEAP